MANNMIQSREQRKNMFQQDGVIIDKNGNTVQLPKAWRDKQRKRLEEKERLKIKIQQALERKNEHQYTPPVLDVPPQHKEHIYPNHLIRRLVYQSISEVKHNLADEYYHKYMETQDRVSSVNFDNDDRVIKTRIKYLLDDVENMTEEFCWVDYLGHCDYYGAECKEEELQTWRQIIKDKHTEIRCLLAKM